MLKAVQAVLSVFPEYIYIFFRESGRCESVQRQQFKPSFVCIGTALSFFAQARRL